MDENNMNFNNVNNPENSNSETKGLGITGPQNFDTKEYTSPYIDPNYKPPRPKKAESSNLGKWAFALSLLGCTTIIGAILAIVDISKKDGKKKDYAIGALCVCGIYFIVFAVGKIKKTNTRNTNETVTSTQVPGDDTISVDDVAEVTIEVTAEATTENATVDELSDEYILSCERDSIAKDGFDSSTNNVVSLQGYEFEVPDYFNDYTTRYVVEDDQDRMKDFRTTEKSSEHVVLRVLIDDLGNNIYEDREKLAEEFAGQVGYISYETNDVVVSGMNSIELSGKFRKEGDEQTYVGDQYHVLMYDSSNNKIIIIGIFETFGTYYDYIDDVKKISNSFRYVGSSGVSQDFKDMLDAYEEFMDEYIEFMKLYNQNPTDAELMSKYFDILTEYTQYASTISKLENSEMTDEEAAYYLEVVNRVNQKLIEAGISN